MKLLSSLLFSAMLIFSLTSCNEEPTTSVTPSVKLNKFEIPADATIDYAILHIYSKAPKGNTTYAHNITADWQECVVTWNSFNNSFDPTVLGSFANITVGWKFVDITSLVAGWVAGTITNYGVLIKDNLADVGYIYERSMYDSRETANSPYLEICYTYNGTQTCTTDVPVEDVYVWQLTPDANKCTDYPNLYTGARAIDQEKYSMLKFEFETPPPVVYNCETAYAYGGETSLQTLCFLNIPNKQGNNWGWTNQIGPGTYNWPIWAGAGQCDRSKGTQVGTLNVVYESGTVTIIYNIDPEYILGDTHVWVGEGTNLLPKKRNGKWDSAPGQFNYNGMNPVEVSGLSGNIWIAAHSGVCWEVVQ